MADLSKVWKAKAKSQKRELERLRLTIQKQNVVVQRARWLAATIRHNRQQCDENFAGDLAPFLDLHWSEIEAINDLDQTYNAFMNNAAWFPISDHFSKITTA